MALIAQIAPMLLALAAQAAEPTGTLTLACQGTSTLVGKDTLTTQVSIGIIVNFADRTVAFGGYPEAGKFPVIKIIGISEVTVSFFGGSVPGLHIGGSIDRVTGDVEATSEAADTDNRVISQTLYTLKCKPHNGCSSDPQTPPTFHTIAPPEPLTKLITLLSLLTKANVLLLLLDETTVRRLRTQLIDP